MLVRPVGKASCTCSEYLMAVLSKSECWRSTSARASHKGLPVSSSRGEAVQPEAEEEH